jgi:hypothetical protein
LQALGHAIRQSHAHGEWQRASNVLGGLTRWFCHLLLADERLQICNPPKNIALAHDNPSHPIHFLLRDDKLEARLSAKFRKAFGVDLVVHRNAGNQVPLHVGERPTPLPGEDRVSMSYIERLEKLPALHTQGDGMRGFAGVLLVTSIGHESIMLIDEPEAFLHPLKPVSWARRWSKIAAENINCSSQRTARMFSAAYLIPRVQMYA